MEKSDQTEKKTQASEQEKTLQTEMKEKAVSMCPSGCGTQLEMRKFVDVWDENMKPQPQDVEEDLYCTKCQIRWIKEIREAHSEIFLEESTIKLIAAGAKKLQMNPDEFLKKAARDYLDELKKPETDKTPIEYEQVTVKIPKAVMDLLRHIQLTTGDTPEQDIEYYVVDSVRSRMDADVFLPTSKELTDKFSLNPVFKEILNDTIEE